jgi:hypothetical protein
MRTRGGDRRRLHAFVPIIMQILRKISTAMSSSFHSQTMLIHEASRPRENVATLNAKNWKRSQMKNILYNRVMCLDIDIDNKAIR